jgi:hypothetical protein
MGIKNKSWSEQNHPMQEFKSSLKDVDGNPWSPIINVGVYWGCRARDCDAEFLVNEVPKSDDGFCLECREIIYETIGIS